VFGRVLRLVFFGPFIDELAGERIEHLIDELLPGKGGSCGRRGYCGTGRAKEYENQRVCQPTHERPYSINLDPVNGSIALDARSP
jgi:hypothetical protein